MGGKLATSIVTLTRERWSGMYRTKEKENIPVTKSHFNSVFHHTASTFFCKTTLFKML